MGCFEPDIPLLSKEGNASEASAGWLVICPCVARSFLKRALKPVLASNVILVSLCGIPVD